RRRRRRTPIGHPDASVGDGRRVSRRTVRASIASGSRGAAVWLLSWSVCGGRPAGAGTVWQVQDYGADFAELAASEFEDFGEQQGRGVGAVAAEGRDREHAAVLHVDDRVTPIHHV